MRLRSGSKIHSATPNFLGPLWNRPPQTIFVLNKLQIRWHPLRACVSIPAVSEQECQNLPPLRNLSAHGPLARHVKLRVAHAPGTFSPSPWARDPDMHHGTCVTHVPWCMPGSLTSGFLWSRWRGKRSRYSQRMRNQLFYISGKRPMGERSLSGTGTRWFQDFQAIWRFFIWNKFFAWTKISQMKTRPAKFSWWKFALIQDETSFGKISFTPQKNLFHTKISDTHWEAVNSHKMLLSHHPSIAHTGLNAP